MTTVHVPTGEEQATTAILSTVAQQQMGHEKSVLPLAGKQNHSGTIAPPSLFPTPTEHHIAQVADNRAPLEAGPQISGTCRGLWAVWE
jgi:hypothetical protein